MGRHNWKYLLTMAATPSTLAQKRVALVIGNADYTHAPHFRTAQKDAELAAG